MQEKHLRVYCRMSRKDTRWSAVVDALHTALNTWVQRNLSHRESPPAAQLLCCAMTAVPMSSQDASQSTIVRQYSALDNAPDNSASKRFKASQSQSWEPSQPMLAEREVISDSEGE